MSMISDTEMKDIINNSMSAIKEKTKELVVERVSNSISYTINDVVYKEVEKAIKTDVAAIVDANKSLILKAIPEAFKSFIPTLQKAIEAKIAENLKQSWSVTNIMKAIFN